MTQLQLNTHREGPESGTPIVLINGLFAALTSWDPVMPKLRSCNTLRYDGPGQGESEKPDRVYDMDLLMEALVEVLKAHHFPPTWLVGISNGGCIALEAARRLPEQVLGVVAADCYDRISPLLQLKLDSWLAAHEKGGPCHRFDVATPWIWSNRILREHPELPAYYRAKADQHQPHAVRNLILGALNHQIDVTQIQQPVLLLCGEEDLLTPPFEMRDMAQRLPNGRFQMVPGAHASLLEHPDIFNDTILPFIEATHVG